MKNKTKFIRKTHKSKKNNFNASKQQSKQQNLNLQNYTQLIQSIEPIYQSLPIYTGGRIVVGKSYLYSSSQNKLIIYDPIKKETVDIIIHQNQQIVNFCVNSADTLIVTFTSNNLLRLIKRETKQQISCMKLTKYFAMDLCFSPNDKYLAVGCVNSTIKIITVTTWKETHSYKHARFGVKKLQWYPNSDQLQIISLDEEQNLIIFDYLLNKIVYSGNGFGNNFIITRDGKHIVTCGNNIKIWNYKTKNLESQVETSSEVNTLYLLQTDYSSLNKFAKSSQILLFAGETLELSYFNFNDPNHQVLKLNDLLSGGLVKIMFMKQLKKIILVSIEQNIAIVNFQQNQFSLEHTVLGYADQIIDIKFSKKINQNSKIEDQLIVMATNSPLLKIVQLNTKNVHLVQGHRDIILSLDYIHPYIISAGKDKLIKLWKIQQDNHTLVNLIATYKGHTQDISCIALGINYKYLVSASEDKTIKIWSFYNQIQTKDIKKSNYTVIAHQKSINSIKINFDQSLIASCSQDKIIKIWDQNLILKAMLTGHRRSVWDIAFHKKQKLLASVSADGLVKIWNLVNFQCISSMGEGQSLLKVAWLLFNQLITTSVDGIIRIWNIRKLTSIAIDKHEGKIWALDVSQPDNNNNFVMITGGVDSKFIIWKDDTESKVNEFKTNQQKNEKQLMLHQRLLHEGLYKQAATLAFKSDLNQLFINSIIKVFEPFIQNEVEFQENQIIQKNQQKAVQTDQQILKFIKQLLDHNQNKLLKIIEEMNSTTKFFKVANKIFQILLQIKSLQDFVSLEKTYVPQLKKFDKKENIFNQKNAFLEYLQRMQTLNQKHRNRLQKYIKRSYWMDYLYAQSTSII